MRFLLTPFVISFLQTDQTSLAPFFRLQNIIVDPRFKNTVYRHDQNYVGENLNPYFQKIYYISPKHKDVSELMHCSLLLEHATAIFLLLCMNIDKLPIMINK